MFFNSNLHISISNPPYYLRFTKYILQHPGGNIIDDNFLFYCIYLEDSGFEMGFIPTLEMAAQITLREDKNEWGMTGNSSRIKMIMDNLAFYGDIDPFIVVTPNGRSAANHAKDGSDYNSFYVFGKELRNDLIPYIDSHYSIYADYNEDDYDPSASRQHRAMAGLSMGGMQTINIGIGECIDLFGYFCTFSAAPTSNPAAKTAKLLEDSEYLIYYFYNICGESDNVALSAHTAAAKTLPDVCDKFVAGENFMWQEVPGVHNFDVWYLVFIILPSWYSNET